MTDQEEGPQKNSGSGVGVGIALGLPFGAALGMLLFDNLVLGAGIGLAMGIAVGAGFEMSRKGEESE